MNGLPAIPELKRIVQAMATLDLILEPDWEYRTYSYNSRWADNEEMASMRNGSGDEWFLVFNDDGWVGLKGFDHEAAAAGDSSFGQALQKAVPESLSSFAQEPAFRWDAVTFCLWCLSEKPVWVSGQEAAGLDASIETGQAGLLAILSEGPEGYKSYADAYFEKNVPLEAITAIYERKPLTAGLVEALNPDVSLSEIAVELEEIGFPHKEG